ncbi:MAG: efflux RND transporter periplasmic adaptor subunit [bacterium]
MSSTSPELQNNSPAVTPNGKPMDSSKAVQGIVNKKRKKRTRNVIVSILTLLVVGFGVWYFFFRAEPEVQPFIRYAAIDKGDIVKAVSATGTLQATKTVQVGSQVSGTIRALKADFNTRVKKGDLIAELDPTFYQAAVRSAEANYGRAKADLENAERNASRNKELFAKSLVSKAEYDLTETTLAGSKANLVQVQASLDQANVNLSYTKIHAPISGIVTQRSVDVGQTVAASLSAPTIFIIAEDLTEMEVQANVDEADIGQVRQGEDVSFTVDAFPGERFKGAVKMVRLNPVIQQNVVTYTVVISAQNKEEKLYPGMTATVAIVNSSVENVLRIPAAAARFIPLEKDATVPKFNRPQGGDTTARKWSGAGKFAKGDSSHGGRDTTKFRRSKNDFGIIYRKLAKNPQNPDAPTMEPIRIKMGITDGMFAEVVWSDKPLNAGDSLAVGMVMPSKGPQANAPGTNPFGNQARPGGGGGGGGIPRR